MKLINYFIRGFSIPAFIAGAVMTFITYSFLLPHFNFEVDNDLYNLTDHYYLAIFSTILGFYLVAYTMINRQKKRQKKKGRSGFIILSPTIILGFIFACVMMLYFISMFIHQFSPILMIMAILYTIDEGRKITKGNWNKEY